MELIVNEIEVTLKTILNSKVVKGMIYLQASYNEDANKTVKKASEEKAKKNDF